MSEPHIPDSFEARRKAARMRRLLVASVVWGIGWSQLQAAPVAPKLIVLMSVDQFRGDYVQRYGSRWSRGLRQLFDRGAYYSQAAYPYMNTVTCAGHATMSTGTLPATHGIPLNAWWDRGTGAQVSCTRDDTVRNIAHGREAARGGDSARRLLVPTFADELRLQSGVVPRVVSLSLKARSAIMMAGHGGTLVAWHDGTRGFVTSSAYSKGPVPFLQDYQRSHPIEADAGKVWKRRLPDNAYVFTDEALGENPGGDWTRVFPHALPDAPGSEFHARWEATPLADAYLGKMAAAAVDHFKLGQGAGTDFLAVSFSSLDVVGHAFGPRSHEVQDVLVQLDETIEQLLQALDRTVGRDKYVVALTGDHGVSPIPEQLVQEHMEAGRISTKDLVDRAEAALATWMGAIPHVDSLLFTELYFKRGVYAAMLDQPQAMKSVIDALESAPGVARVLRSDTIQSVSSGFDELSKSALRSFVPGRSGDLLIVPKPYFLNSTAGATHGTGYQYDARVPVLLAGAGIRPGEHTQPASPADIVPTLAVLAGITMPRTDGRVLHEALLQNAAAALSPATAAAPTRPQGAAR